MKVYAVAVQCADEWYHDYTILGDCIYLNEDDAERALREKRRESPGLYEIYVCSFDLIGNPSDISKEEKK